MKNQPKNKPTCAERQRHREARRAGERIARQGVHRVEPIIGGVDQSDPDWTDKHVGA